MNQEINNVKSFDLGLVLAISTQRFLTDYHGMLELLEHLTNQKMFTSSIPEISSKASQYVLDVYPELAEASLVDGQLKEFHEIEAWINMQKAKFGDSLTLAPMPPGLYRGENLDGEKPARTHAHF